ncbi:hypothetical protein E2636_11015 [Paenisporosarcina antarctica]|uniref:Transposase IS204/IS1001/IS1096/IS1165 DDE domain-containing protein n=1 Tax=Paenisporosarcina antarctica TaxID=417367 RepID=A0A4P7A4K8_9BACL|nr:hypothetical protein E2636_11015 [Paenisporosarcina antarctica]
MPCRIKVDQNHLPGGNSLVTGYVSVIKELFPQAKIIIDPFHLVQLMNRSMNKCRITMINKPKTDSYDNSKKYRRLKR